MCTAISLYHSNCSYFGRNMDIPFFFNQRPMLIPKGFQYLNRAENKQQRIKNSILGMGSVIDGHPAMADAMNDKGLACAGLNFAGFAKFDDFYLEDKINVSPYDFILWVLSEFESLTEVKEALQNLHFYSIPINQDTSVAQLHWMLADRSGHLIVVECTASGINVYDNPVSVMTNNPEFPWHLTNLREYLKISPVPADDATWSALNLKALGVGSGTLGIPGDYSSVSRFVRAAFTRAHLPNNLSEDEHISQFFTLLDAAFMPKGCVLTENNLCDFTVYSSCMDLTQNIYYYKNYENNRINAVKLIEKEGTELICYPYITKQDINYLN